jgi:hypothetical protein
MFLPVPNFSTIAIKTLLYGERALSNAMRMMNMNTMNATNHRTVFHRTVHLLMERKEDVRYHQNWMEMEIQMELLNTKDGKSQQAVLFQTAAKIKANIENQRNNSMNTLLNHTFKIAF